MRRDIVCLMRIIADSLPRKIRDSYLFFRIAKLIYKLPENLYYFREKYDRGLYKDLSIFYDPDSPFFLKRSANNTDINSDHLNKIIDLVRNRKPKSLIDIGCGTGFLINLISNEFPKISLAALDFNIPSLIKKDKKIKIFEGDIQSNLNNIENNKFEFVICAHVLEHLENPEIILDNLRRITSKYLLIVCPLEKKFKWGINYHINFFNNHLSFLGFIRRKSKDENNQIFKSNYSCYLGDILYIEKY